MNEKFLTRRVIILIIILFLWLVFIGISAFAQERTLILTWDEYTDPTGIGIRIYQTTEKGIYNFGKDYAIADVSSDVNEVSICINLDTLYFVATAYNTDIESEPSNEIEVLGSPDSPKIEKKSLFKGCGL